jgi:hypothetical protein
MKTYPISVCIFFLFGLSFNGYSQFRKYSNEFLNIGAAARGLGMGNAQLASVEDATAGYWNPALLSAVSDQPTVSLMHADYFAGIAKYDFAAVAIPNKENKSTIGFSLLRFAVDDIPNTLFLVEPDGSLNYNNIQSFSSADYAFLFSYAKQIKKIKNYDVSFGANTKIIYRKVGTFASAWGFGLDAAIAFTSQRWKFGAVIKDVTTTFNAWNFTFTEKEKQVLYLTNNKIPIQSTELTQPRLMLGAAHFFNLNKSLSILSEINTDITFDGKRNTIISGNAISIDPRIGLELGIKKNFFVRAGISNFQNALADSDTLNQKKVWIYQPSIGAGFKVKNFYVDYAFTNLANQQNPLYTHVFSIKLNLVKKNEN